MCIKKSDSGVNTAIPGGNNKTATSSARSRKSSRTIKQRIKLDEDENDELDYEPKRKKERNTKRQTSSATVVASNDNDEHREAIEQTKWGALLPEPVLLKVFQSLLNCFIAFSHFSYVVFADFSIRCG